MSDFILPDIGEGIVECELVKWLIQEGDTIEEDQPVAEVMTDKALVEIPAPHAGRVTRLYHREGETARVHAPLFAVEPLDGASPDEATSPTDQAASRTDEAPSAMGASDVSSGATQDAPGSADEAAASEDFILPDIGEGIVECEVVEWRIREGDEIEEDQPVVDVMTDKALVEITAPRAGRVTRLYHQPRENARVHSPLFAYVPRDGQVERPSTPARHAPAGRAPSEASSGAERAAGTGKGPHGRIPASPAVRRLVRELGVRLEDVPGSGKHGRVLKEDILAFDKSRRDETPITAGASEATATTERAEQGEVRVEPIRGVRAAMARRMSEAASTIPHFSYGDEIDVTELLALRERLKPMAERDGTRLTLMPLIMKALGLAVTAYPILNSRISDDGSEIHYQPHCNVGMAVDSRAGLLVPNVKRVERLSIREIADEVARLTEAAREGRVSQADLQGGTISISNIGALGGTYAAPIINPPEVAIVALGRVQTLPRFDADGKVVSRSIMTITWSGDHRIIDGGTISRFCNRWKEYLEAPQTMLLDMT
ncbi:MULTISPECIES: dihydrolipoyllysine-residue acetyltransferase [unclassified Modicisalibacter]|uniref:dihydrolipoyllysine-residue acetyltransferase n=1 Tax=unclassified Modicisalibacter TaxID=2679913 RepID=UPI001CCFDC18|nr:MULTISPECIES: dihydrolipoyllysine-residue acetyltransferase [unclassified Modicisalibacter]MBZ9560364.1 dihydrolipoyllysine-residue acetyltransferase [Modicisalibacter sp. R2A 31.J]MBZ9576273.1 dihydrolipoyllysine-residue acetyltransferase [Modicisalibacter sp. MOD 31.J]